MAAFGGGGSGSGRRDCCSSQQIAAAWAWFERSGACSSLDAAPRRSELLSGAALGRKAARRLPSRFKEEFLASADHDHSSEEPHSAATILAQPRRCHSFNSSDTTSWHSLAHNPERDHSASEPFGARSTAYHLKQRHIQRCADDHGDSTALSNLLDDFEVESLCRQLRLHMQCTIQQPLSEYTGAKEDDTMTPAAHRVGRSSDHCHPSRRIYDASDHGQRGSASIRRSHSMSEFMSQVLHFPVNSHKPRNNRHRPLICSSLHTIDSIRSNSLGSSNLLNTVATRHKPTFKHRTKLQEHDSENIAPINAVHETGNPGRSADELDYDRLYRYRHVHHHHHHHFHVLHHAAEGALLQREHRIGMGRDIHRKKEGASSLLPSKQSKLENMRLHVELRNLQPQQRAHRYAAERNEKLPYDSEACYGEKNDQRADERSDYRGLLSPRDGQHSLSVKLFGIGV